MREPCKMRLINMKILLVEDNKIISKGVVYSLEKNGYTVTLCETFDSALESTTEDFDLMIIDIGLPDGNGFELYEHIKRFSNTPAIFLTAVDDEDSIVKGFELGADDYITKPFSIRELLARVNRITSKNKKSSKIAVDDIEIDLESNIVYKNSVPVELTALEFKIFSMLISNAGKTVSRELILEKIWDVAGNYVNDNTLTVYIKRIRQKLDTDLIKTVKGIGYRLEEK